MKKIVRNDWKRHSAPHELTFDLTGHRNSVGEVFDQKMESFKTEMKERQRTNTVGRERKNTVPSTALVACESVVELSTAQNAPGVLKIFGETILPGVHYKSVLASCRSTALELVKQAVERFGLPVQSYKKFVLCDVVGRYKEESETKYIRADETLMNFGNWEGLYARILSDRDKPLLLQKFWKPIEGCSRRYELHERAQLIDLAETDDTSGLNSNARKILISKLRPGAIPLFDPAQCLIHANGLTKDYSNVRPEVSSKMSETDGSSVGSSRGNCSCKSKSCADDKYPSAIPLKHPFFLNIRGYDITKDKVLYPVKYKKFTFGNPNVRNQVPFDDVPKIQLLAPDIEGTHCNFKVYKFKRTNGVQKSEMDKYNYFLELEPLGNNVRVNGHKISGKSIVKSGDILNVGIYYVFVFKDCSKNADIPLALPWLPISELDSNEPATTTLDKKDLKLHLYADDENKSNTDESMEVSIPEKMAFAYKLEKEEELVKYICAIIQQQNTQRTYPLTVAFMFSMCMEYASRKFDRRQLKHLFLRILFTTRENVAETAKSLSTSKFSCTLLDAASQRTEGDQKLERLLLWISNCVQLLLFLKHTFQLPEVPTTDIRPSPGYSEKSPRKDCCIKQTGQSSPRKEDSAKHAMAQLVTGLEEIIMFCFQQSVYTITKALHPALSALLDSNPFSDINSEQCSMEDITRMYGTLAEVTHAVMLHEGITRQLFTYLFFFTSTNVFNKLILDEKSCQYYNWSAGVRIRANLGQLEDWATQNGLEDEFSQMFERLLAASELLATSKNTLVKYQWSMMKDHYQPLSAGQIYHILRQYQLGTKNRPSVWSPSAEELGEIEKEDLLKLSLCDHPPFALPDNCGVIDLMRVPEDASFWNHHRRLKTLYGVVEDDSDSGFSRSNTPRGAETSPTEEVKDATDGLQVVENILTESDTIALTETDRFNVNQTEIQLSASLEMSRAKQRTRIPVKKSNTNPWTLKVPKPGTGICKCATLPRSPPNCQGCNFSDVKRNTTDTLMSDLMSEENRDNLESGEKYKVSKEKVISQIHKKTNNAEDTNTARIRKSGTKTLNRSDCFKGNISNCSARNVKPYLRERSHTVGNEKELQSCLTKKTNKQSVSMEDVNLPFMYRKPILSASFYEAIERGNERENRRISNVSNASSQLGSISESVICLGLPNRSAETGTGNEESQSLGIDHASGDVRTSELERQNTTESLLSDDVFIEESLDNFYRKSVKEINIDEKHSFLPENNTFKPISTSSKDNRRSSSQSQKLMAISFDAGSYSSAIELARNTLYVSGVNEVSGDNSDQDLAIMKCDNMNEKLPEGMLVEVNEDILASRKRHGSSINVVPNSPRLCLKQELKQASIEHSEQRQASPCPLFTVYLRKADRGLGLGLIDGLHTPLRLTGIYIKKILPNSPAAMNGCLQVGDRLLAVNGTSVIGANYQSTMSLVRAADDALTLLVARGNESMARKISSSNV